ncbi:surface lipoprotein assembly modifier [Neisseria bacilliformis]|uniref:surface lipoprotein assembly modifier n=1 Tax=Neisseria bacilliformis TaxID=267212 RepID=UPI0039C9996A
MPHAQQHLRPHTPLVSASWLGGRQYSRNTGANASFSRWATPRLQLSGAYTFIRKKYRDERYAGYNAALNGLSASAVYALTPNWFAFGGLGVQREKTDDQEETSTRRFANLGTLYRFANGTNIRIGGRYVSRKFAHPAALYGGITRSDRETYADASVWKEKWLPGGITPKLEFSYLKVRSNIYAFPRNKKQISFTLEKEF